MGNCRVLQSRDCRITQPFHYADDVWKYYHGGMDLVRYFAQLDWIIAHTEGKVIGIETNYTGAIEDGSYGNYVWILHRNGCSTLYAHLAYGTIQVSLGQWVSTGQVIGYMDNTGHSYGGHLHWEYRTPANERINPEYYLNRDLPAGWVTYVYDGWYYVHDGAVDYSYTGVAPNENGWWYVKNGKVDFSYTGIAQNEYGWWRIENGKVNFKFTGLAQNENGWWYLKDGKVDFTYNGIVQNSAGWWVVVNGKVDFTYNGLANNEHGWWMCQKGKVNFDYNGLATNKNGTWVLKEGKVDFDFSGDYVFSGSTWKVSKGKVQF